jgi:hypothetical protein
VEIAQAKNQNKDVIWHWFGHTSDMPRVIATTEINIRPWSKQDREERVRFLKIFNQRAVFHSQMDGLERRLGGYSPLLERFRA